ncbi:MAG: hypothetical protein IJ242_15525 [Clostridia bacterium]|nr:hypothetical protein [Clostridia bacterium]
MEVWEQEDIDFLTKTIYREIRRQFKSVRNFSTEMDIPYSTLSNMLTRGIKGVGYSTIERILSELDIKSGVPSWARDLAKRFEPLDDTGREYVYKVLTREAERCEEEMAKKGKYAIHLDEDEDEVI